MFNITKKIKIIFYIIVLFLFINSTKIDLLSNNNYTIISNPSTNDDEVYDIAIDNDFIYLAGSDNFNKNLQWRIEKRNKSNGELVEEFGLKGIIQSNPSKYLDEAYSIEVDDNYIYIGGIDEIPKNFEWRIEKRDKNTGNLIKEFGKNGVILSNPSKEWDEINSIKIDDKYIYIIGYDENTKKKENQWRIEKRDKIAGNLIKEFGKNGVIQINPSEKSDSALSLTIDESSIYIAGYDNYMNNKREWRIEKRDKNTGNLVDDFGENGVIQSNLSKDFDIAYSICNDDKYLYIAGYDKNISDRQWRIEKRDKITGYFADGFGDNGVINSNPSKSYDNAKCIVNDNNYIYIIGDEKCGTDYRDWQWRIEKRDKNTGNMIVEFGNNGVILINSSIDDDYGTAICVDNNNIYFAGNEKTNAYMDWQWRLEKVDKITGK